METSSQTPRVVPTVHTMVVKRVSAKTIIVIRLVVVKAFASAKVVKRVTSSKAVTHVVCTVLGGQENRCSTRVIHSEDLAGQVQG